MSTTSSLAKKIGYWSATSIIVGSIIGSGVFMKPASMAGQLGSPIWLTVVWVIAGVFSLFGALIYAELGAMMPETGGIYVYFRKMFGDFVAYLYGWAAFSVINTTAIAAIAFVCAQYADYFLHLPRFSEVTEQSVVWHLPFVGDLFPLKKFWCQISGDSISSRTNMVELPECKSRKFVPAYFYYRKNGSDCSISIWYLLFWKWVSR